jgi:hypothetical protein
MIQDMANMEARCILYGKVVTFVHLEQNKTSFLTVNITRIVRLMVQGDLIITISFMSSPGDQLKQTLADVVLLEQCSEYSRQPCHFGCHTHQFIHLNKHTISDQLIAYLGAVGNPSNLQLYAARFILSIKNMLAANYSIVT